MVFGVPVYLDWTLLLLVFCFAFRRGGNFIGAIFSAVVSIVLIFTSVLLHELGHTVAALSFGCRVRDITLTFIGGRATLLDMPRESWKELVVAASGPLVSLVLWLAPLGALPRVPTCGPSWGHVFTGYFSDVNRMLFLFNLIPAFPMDGGRIFRAVLSFYIGRPRAGFVAFRVGQVLAACMGLYALFHGFDLPLMVIAYVVYMAAAAEYAAEARGRADRRTREPPDDAVVISPPPYGGRDEFADISRGR